jgi:hypothetical protein
VSSKCKRKCFNINLDLLPHISSQPNQSFYINNLIKKDINNSTSDIIKLIKSYLSQNNIDTINTNFVDSINNILKFEDEWVKIKEL